METGSRISLFDGEMMLPRRKSTGNQRGLTLLELMMVAALGLALTLGMTTILNRVRQGAKRAEQSLVVATAEGHWPEAALVRCAPRGRVV